MMTLPSTPNSVNKFGVRDTYSTRTLLVIDKSASYRQLLSEFFRAKGFHVDDFGTIEESLAAASSQIAAVTIVDHDSWAEDPSDAVDELRRLQPDIQIIVRSDSSSSTSLEGQPSIEIFACSDERGDFSDLLSTVNRAFQNALLIELTRREREYQDLLNDTAAVVWECSLPERNFTSVSRQVEPMLGYSVARLLDERDLWTRIIYPEDQQRVVEGRAEALERGQDFQIDYRVISADGRVVWLHEVVRVICSRDGIPVKLRGVMSDITSRKVAEAKIHENEQRLQAIFDSTFQFIGRLSPDGILLEANKTALSFANLNSEDVVGKRFWETAWWEGNPFEIGRLQQAVQKAAQGELVRYDMEAYGAEQTEVIDFSIKPVFDCDGNVQNLVAEGRIVTEQLAAAKALQESEKKYRSLVKNATVCIHELDQEGRFTSMNPAGLGMMGLSDESIVLGQDYVSMVDDGDKSRICSLFEQALIGESSRFRFLSITGRWMDSCFVPILGDEQRVENVMGITRDITEQLMAEKKIGESEARFRAIFEQVAVGVVQVESVSGRIVQANKRFLEIVEADTLQGKSNWIDLVHGDDVDSELQNFRSLKSGEAQKYNSELRMQRQDRSFVWVRVTASRMSQLGLGPETHIVIVQDISDQKLIEARLELARFSIEHSATAIFWIRRDASFFYVNKSAIRRFGYSNQEWLSMSVSDIDPSYPVEVWPDFWSEVKQKKTLSFESVIVDSDGLEIPVKITTNYLQFRSQEFVFAFVHDISDRVEAEKRLKLTESRYRAMFEQAAVGVAQLDSKTGCFLDINQRFCDIVGFSSEEMLGSSLTSIAHPNDAKQDQELLARLRQNEIHEFTMERRYVRKDGKVVWVNLSVSPMRTVAESSSTLIVIAEDITTRKLAQLHLRESEALFRNLVETAPFGVQRNTTDGRITFANRALGQIYRCSESELIDKYIWDFAISLESREEMKARVDLNLANGASYIEEFETRNRTADGQIIDVNITWTFDHDDRGNIVGFIVIVTDITARKQAERALEFQADVLNRVSDAVMVTDPQGDVTYANEAAERLLNVRRASPAPFTKPGQVLSARDTSGFEVSGNWEGELQYQVDGQTHYFETKRNRFFPSDTNESLVLTVMHDVSARKQADLEIRQHSQMLAHMTRLSSMGELVAEIAHEVKQPLYAVTNFATAASVTLDLLEKEEKLEKRTLEALMECNEGIRDAAQRASEIINHSMAFTRMGERERIPVDINECVKAAIGLVNFEMREMATVFKIELENQLPSVLADQIQCEQVLVNLLSNALDEIGGDDQQRWVTVRTIQQGDEIEVQVEDNGGGIAKEEQAKIFDAFYTTKKDGMGVGLAVSRTIIEDHEGKIWVTSNRYGGSTFHFTLPVQSDCSLEEGAEA